METDLPQTLIKKPSHKNKPVVVLILAGIGLLLIGFVSGYYANNGANQASARLTMAQNSYPNLLNNGSAGYGGSHRGEYGNRVIGQVSSINGQAIVIAEQNGTSQSIQVTNSTQFSNGASISQIAVGDTIMAIGQKNSSGVIQATRIFINPSFGNSPAATY